MTNLILYFKLAGIFFVVAIFIAAIWYYNWSQDKIQQYQQDIITLNISVSQNESTIHKLNADINKAKEQLIIIQKKFEQSRENVIILQNKLSKHNIGMLARIKPKLVETRINKGTLDVNRCFEILSGSPLSDKEKTAFKRSEINSACSNIANPKYMKK